MKIVLTYLFSYDGDDAPAKPEASVQHDYPPEPVEAPAPAPYSSDVAQDPKAEPATDTTLKDEPMYGNNQNGDAEHSWNGASEEQSQYNNGGMDHEPPQIGIKEDG